MQQKSLLMTLFITGLASIVTLSSFYKPKTEDFSQNITDDQIEYNAQGKQSKKRGGVTLSGSF